MANASPSASITVVLEVGAMFNGQASCSTFTSRQRCAFWPNVDFGAPHIAMILTWNRATAGRIRSNSSVSPLALKASTTSPSAIMPRSPCSAFEESSTTAGEPVLVSVAAIFAPMCPDLPTPITTTFPLASTASLINSTAREKFSSSRSRSRWSSKISMSRTRAAFSRESIECNNVGRCGDGQGFARLQ